MFNFEQAHMILDEMVSAGTVYDANKGNILGTVALVSKVGKSTE